MTVTGEAPELEQTILLIYDKYMLSGVRLIGPLQQTINGNSSQGIVQLN